MALLLVKGSCMDIFMFLTRVVFNFVIFMIFATFHEYAHGWVAYRLGDPTAKENGRLSLNPIVHIHLFWTIIMPILLLIFSNGRFVLGSAKPVPVNQYLMRNPQRDILWVSIAGPMANAIWMLALIGAMKVLVMTNIITPASPIYTLLYVCMYINAILLVFNLLPIPPLDGSSIIEYMLPERYIDKYEKIKPYIFIAFITLMYFGLFNKIFGYIFNLILVAFRLESPRFYGLL